MTHALRNSLILLTITAIGCVGSDPTRQPEQRSSALNSDGTIGPRVDLSTALVQLYGEPLATYTRTKPAQGKKIDFNNATVRSYRAYLSGLRKDFKTWLRSNAPKARVTGDFDISLNAVAVSLNGESLAKIAAASIVKHHRRRP